MNEDMKNVAILILLMLSALWLMNLIRYQERMEKFNASQCAVYGYEADCTTPLDK